MNDVVQSLKDLGQLKLSIMAGVAGVLVIFFVFISLRISAPVMEPLYSGLPMQDSGVIVKELDKQGIKYELRANGGQILVPADQVLKLRVALAQQGIPSNGSLVGYEIFDRSDALGTSNFVLNVNMLRALEGELARTISSFNKVENARVHLVMPKRELFTRERQEPTASVVLKLRGGALNKAETDAISHLISTAVPGLKPAKITIVDSAGRLLARGGDDPNNPEVAASTAEEFRVAYETRMAKAVEALLEQSVGMGKVTAKVTADIDFNRVVRNSETFDPESQVARSVQGTSETEESQENSGQDNTTVANNLPSAQGQQGGNPTAQRRLERSDETTNYEISKVVENHVKETGTVNRLSVAVLVDGVYGVDDAGKPSYVPRSEAELQQLGTLVRTAIGFDESRGDVVEVVNMRFSGDLQMAEVEGPFDWIKGDLKNIVQTLVLGGVAILVILLVIRPLINRAIESSAAAAQLAEEEKSVLSGPALSSSMGDQPALGYSGDGLEGEEEDMINIDQVRGRVRSGNYRRILDVIDSHPEDALNVLRNWFAPVE
jgi:flagellar M-ring protein FliF